ncbi:MAG: Integral membrane protein, partial [uncultured Rubrobacteraceae bacterium]
GRRCSGRGLSSAGGPGRRPPGADRLSGLLGQLGWGMVRGDSDGGLRGACAGFDGVLPAVSDAGEVGGLCRGRACALGGPDLARIYLLRALLRVPDRRAPSRCPRRPGRDPLPRPLPDGVLPERGLHGGTFPRAYGGLRVGGARATGLSARGPPRGARGGDAQRGRAAPRASPSRVGALQGRARPARGLWHGARPGRARRLRGLPVGAVRGPARLRAAAGGLLEPRGLRAAGHARRRLDGGRGGDGVRPRPGDPLPRDRRDTGARGLERAEPRVPDLLSPGGARGALRAAARALGLHDRPRLAAGARALTPIPADEPAAVRARGVPGLSRSGLPLVAVEVDARGLAPLLRRARRGVDGAVRHLAVGGV